MLLGCFQPRIIVQFFPFTVEPMRSSFPMLAISCPFMDHIGCQGERSTKPWYIKFEFTTLDLDFIDHKMGNCRKFLNPYCLLDRESSYPLSVLILCHDMRFGQYCPLVHSVVTENDIRVGHFLFCAVMQMKRNTAHCLKIWKLSALKERIFDVSLSQNVDILAFIANRCCIRKKSKLSECVLVSAFYQDMSSRSSFSLRFNFPPFSFFYFLTLSAKHPSKMSGWLLHPYHGSLCKNFTVEEGNFVLVLKRKSTET